MVHPLHVDLGRGGGRGEGGGGEGVCVCVDNNTIGQVYTQFVYQMSFEQYYWDVKCVSVYLVVCTGCDPTTHYMRTTIQLKRDFTGIRICGL